MTRTPRSAVGLASGATCSPVMAVTKTGSTRRWFMLVACSESRTPTVGAARLDGYSPVRGRPRVHSTTKKSPRGVVAITPKMSRVLGCVPNDATEDPSASTELRPLEVPQEPPAQEKSVTGAAVTAGCKVEPVHARPNRIGWARLLKRVLAMTSLEHQLVFAEACAVDIDRPPQRPCSRLRCQRQPG